MALTLTPTINVTIFRGRSSVGFHPNFACELDWFNYHPIIAAIAVRFYARHSRVRLRRGQAG